MKFICEKSIIQDAINTTSRAVPSKSPISSLEGLMIYVGENVRITGYDLKKAIYTTFDADILEPGTAVINARLFSEMIRRLPDGLVSVSCNADKGINVKCGKSEYNFMGLDPKEYPEIPSFDGLNHVSIPQGMLKEMIAKTIFAVSREEIRPIYTGTLFEIEEDKLTLVSVDGYRLARRTETVENSNNENCSFVVPGFALSDVEKICQDSNVPVEISVGEKHISFTIENNVVITRRLEGEFLNHKKSVPENFRFEVEIERQELIQVIDRVSLMLSEKNGNPVRMTFNDNSIDCLCLTPLGKAEDTCSCEGTGEGTLIGFNDRYIMDALKAAEGEKIMFCMNTSSSPCIIRATEDTGKYTYMILPVRLHQ